MLSAPRLIAPLGFSQQAIFPRAYLFLPRFTSCYPFVSSKPSFLLYSNIHPLPSPPPSRFQLLPHTRAFTFPALLTAPLIFISLLLTLWLYKSLVLILFQNKIIYMPSMPPFSRSERISDYATACRPVAWREERIVATDGTALAIAVWEAQPANRYEEQVGPGKGSGVGEMVMKERKEKRKKKRRRVVIIYFQGFVYPIYVLLSSLPPIPHPPINARPNSHITINP